MLHDSHVHAKQLSFIAGCWSGAQGLPDRRNISERIADLGDSERISGLVLLSLSELLQGGAAMNSAFDILKKADVASFEWVEVVRDLQTAEARI